MDTTTINLLQTDKQYALKFALDNNFLAIQSKLADKGYIVSDQVAAYSLINDLISLGKYDVVQYVMNVPYNDAATNGTGGLRDYFVQNSPPPPAPVPNAAGMTPRSFNWSGLLTTIGVVLTASGVAIGQTTTPGAPGSGAQTQEQIDAAAAEERRKTAWMWGLIVGGVIILLIGLYFAFRGKPAKKD